MSWDHVINCKRNVYQNQLQIIIYVAYSIVKSLGSEPSRRWPCCSIPLPVRLHRNNIMLCIIVMSGAVLVFAQRI